MISKCCKKGLRLGSQVPDQGLVLWPSDSGYHKLSRKHRCTIWKRVAAECVELKRSAEPKSIFGWWQVVTDKVLKLGFDEYTQDMSKINSLCSCRTPVSLLFLKIWSQSKSKRKYILSFRLEDLIEFNIHGLLKYKCKSKCILSFRLEDPVELLFEPQVSQFLTTLTQDQVIVIIKIIIFDVIIIIVIIVIITNIIIITDLRCVISFSSCELFCSPQHCPRPGWGGWWPCRRWWWPWC